MEMLRNVTIKEYIETEISILGDYRQLILSKCFNIYIGCLFERELDEI